MLEMKLTAAAQQRSNKADKELLPQQLGVSRPPPLIMAPNTAPLAGCRLWRAGGSGRDGGHSLPAVYHSSTGHPPLKDAGVLPPHGEEVGVVVGEADVGDVAAMTLILVVWCLEIKRYRYA